MLLCTSANRLCCSYTIQAAPCLLIYCSYILASASLTNSSLYCGLPWVFSSQKHRTVVCKFSSQVQLCAIETKVCKKGRKCPIQQPQKHKYTYVNSSTLYYLLHLVAAEYRKERNTAHHTIQQNLLHKCFQLFLVVGY